MNRQILNTAMGVALIFVGVLVVAGCVPGELVSVEASSIDAVASADRERASEASVARWEALGDRYSAAHEAERVKAGAAEQARWQAMRAFYEARSRGQLAPSKATIVARWQAMGEFYNLETARAKDDLSPDAARWIELGDSYQELQLATEGK